PLHRCVGRPGRVPPLRAAAVPGPVAGVLLFRRLALSSQPGTLAQRGLAFPACHGGSLAAGRAAAGRPVSTRRPLAQAVAPGDLLDHPGLHAPGAGPLALLFDVLPGRGVAVRRGSGAWRKFLAATACTRLAAGGISRPDPYLFGAG